MDIVYLIIGIVVVVMFSSGWNRRRNTRLLRTVTDLHRGTPSERHLVLQLLKCGIPPSLIYHDLYVEKRIGNYSQVDVVLMTTVGLIVFEVKDYSGWIFGRGDQTYWTQVLSYGKQQYHFYNPVMQNNGHINALRERFQWFADVPIFSVIVFYGDCVLKDVSSIPYGTYIVKPGNVPYLVNSIIANNPPVDQVRNAGIVTVLQTSVENGNRPEIIMQHMQNVRRMSDNKFR